MASGFTTAAPPRFAKEQRVRVHGMGKQPRDGKVIRVLTEEPGRTYLVRIEGVARPAPVNESELLPA